MATNSLVCVNDYEEQALSLLDKRVRDYYSCGRWVIVGSCCQFCDTLCRSWFIGYRQAWCCVDRSHGI